MDGVKCKLQVDVCNMSSALLYYLLHLQEVPSDSAYIFVGVKGMMVDVFDLGTGVE
jgi:hypothetical protein